VSTAEIVKQGFQIVSAHFFRSHSIKDTL